MLRRPSLPSLVSLDTLILFLILSARVPPSRSRLAPCDDRAPLSCREPSPFGAGGADPQPQPSACDQTQHTGGCPPALPPLGDLLGNEPVSQATPNQRPPRALLLELSENILFLPRLLRRMWSGAVGNESIS